jgi:hypothetical protein
MNYPYPRQFSYICVLANPYSQFTTDEEHAKNNGRLNYASSLTLHTKDNGDLWVKVERPKCNPLYINMRVVESYRP